MPWRRGFIAVAEMPDAESTLMLETRHWEELEVDATRFHNDDADMVLEMQGGLGRRLEAYTSQRCSADSRRRPRYVVSFLTKHSVRRGRLIHCDLSMPVKTGIYVAAEDLRESGGELQICTNLTPCRPRPRGYSTRGASTRKD